MCVSWHLSNLGELVARKVLHIVQTLGTSVEGNCSHIFNNKKVIFQCNDY